MQNFEQWLMNELEIIAEHYKEYIGENRNIYYLSMCIGKGNESDGQFYLQANNEYWANGEDSDKPLNIHKFTD